MEISDLKQKIVDLAQKYSSELNAKIAGRVEEMATDDKSHYLIYRVLGITDEEGDLIDIYQNKGRFLYKYAGSFLEEATIMCFEYKYNDSCQKKVRIPNTLGKKPATFEIDCLVNSKAHEIKWKDATTDGDHITKEHTRVQVIKNAGYIPVRIMFYYPQREQAIKIQNTLQTLYAGVNGEYYSGDNAWDYVKNKTGVDLFQLLTDIAQGH